MGTANTVFTLRRKTRMTLGLLLFVIGVLVGTLFFGLVVWANVEAALFNPSIRGELSLRSIRYPVLLTRSEIGIVRASFYNPGPNPTSPTVRASTSFRSIAFVTTEDRSFTIEPGQTVTQSWEVSADNRAWNRFVFFRLYQHASYPLKSASGFCGILVLDIPFVTGRVLSAIIIALSILCMGMGLYLLGRKGGVEMDQPHARFPAFLTLSALVVGGTLAILLGNWLLAAGALILIIILASVMSLALLG